MKAINQLTEVLLKFDGVDGLSVNKPEKQFIIKSLGGNSYLLDLSEHGNNEVLFSFTETNTLTKYGYTVVLNNWCSVWQPGNGLPELLDFITSATFHYQFRFVFDDAERLQLIQQVIAAEMEGYVSTYVNIVLDKKGAIKVEVDFPLMKRNFEVSYLLNGSVNTKGINQMLNTLLQLEDRLNDKITNNDTPEDERMAITMLDIGHVYELIELIINEKELIDKHILPNIKLKTGSGDNNG